MPMTSANRRPARTTLPRDLLILSFFEQQPAVRENAFRQRQVGGHQKRRPVNGVEAQNVLPDQVQIGGPQVRCPFTALI